MAGLSSCLYFILLFFVFDPEYIYKNTSRTSDINLHPAALIFLTLFIAPISEEILFRGSWSKSKILYYLSVFGLPIYIFIIALKSSGYSVAVIFVIILILLQLLNKIKPSFIVLENAIIVVNTLLFAVVHYTTSDFQSISLLVPMLIQFSFGLILCWVVLNYSILKAIILHASINLIIITTVSFISGLENNTVYKEEINNVTIEWKENTSLFTTEKFENSKDSIIAKNMDINTFCKYLEYLQSDFKSGKVEIKKPGSHYDILIYSNTPNDSVNIIKHSRELLLKAKLIDSKY